MPSDIHPEFSRMLKREDKERFLKQRARVLWFYGLSGSGKSTLANALERQMAGQSFYTMLLDGDNVRTGLNNNLGFSDEDRKENIRRVAETARLFLNNGTVTLVSFITPRRELRAMAREIIGPQDFIEIYVKCSFETCSKRDVKGLYAKAAAGGIKHFTGKDSQFEEPAHGEADLVLDTDSQSIDESLATLRDAILPKLALA